MNLIAMMDELLRNRKSLYRTAYEGTNLASLSTRLLVLFLLSSAIYGGVMGAFRCFHPEYFFSDFELIQANGTPIQGEIAGMTADRVTVYTRAPVTPAKGEASIRFNLTNPTDLYRVIDIGEEKGYHKIVLAQGAVLREEGAWLLPFLVALKIPLLFILTLLVCALALYILNLAFGMRLAFFPSMTLMLFALAGTGVMLVVFAPISLLFTYVTTSYHFMKMLHMVVFSIAGLFGVFILGEGLAVMQPSADENPQSAMGRKALLVLCSWLLLYCLVGAQLAWTMKPFLGTPYLPATPPFRVEQGNIFVSTIESFHTIRPPNDGHPFRHTY